MFLPFLADCCSDMTLHAACHIVSSSGVWLLLVLVFVTDLGPVVVSPGVCYRPGASCC